MSKNLRYLTQGAIIAALYVALTWLSHMVGLASGVIQFRLSEALTILPFFTPAAVPGLFVGCLLANLLTGGLPWDVVIGSVATLLGAIGTRLFRRYRWLAPVPPILSNAIIIPFVLRYVYGAEGALYYFAFTVGIGQIVTCGALGLLLLHALLPNRKLFGSLE